MHRLVRELALVALGLGVPLGCLPARAPSAPPPPAPVAAPVAARPMVPAPVKSLWKVQIGKTTFRSTLHVYAGKIVVNSNGTDWRAVPDELDSVWVLTLRGDLMTRIVPPGEGEKDCNGVALAPDGLVFGTDQGTLYKFDWAGALVWELPIFKDIEAAPVLADITRDGVPDVGVGVEEGDFYIIDGKLGKIIHRVYTETGNQGQRGFMTTVAAADVSGDSVEDFFVPGRDGRLRAINGFSGQSLWLNRRPAGLHSAPILVDVDKDKNLELIYATTGGEVLAVEARTGLALWTRELVSPLGPERIFSPVGWLPERSCALVGTARDGTRESVYCVGEEGVLWRWGLDQGKVSSGFVVGDVDGEPGAEVVFGTEAGRVVALRADGSLAWSYSVGAAIECTPALHDLDGDGDLEILVASNDGYLRALQTPGTPPAVLGYYRGNARNTGVLSF